MSQKAKPASSQPIVTLSGEVARQIRQHARASLSAEICGVLIGQDRAGRVEIQACIAGVNAEEAGAHVTFTQDTWEHIYQVKDKQYPGERIVGWYHSHPGFGIFLSEHDSFIHKNFFASPGQVAWVYDPHSDEEGCFGWVNGGIERLSQVTISDRRGGERVQESAGQQPMMASETSAPPTTAIPQMKAAREFPPQLTSSETNEQNSNDSLLRLTTTIFSYLTVLLLGFLISWYLFPHVELVPVPVDPITLKPLPGYSFDVQPGSPSQSAAQPENQGKTPQSATPDKNHGKENNGRPK